MNETDKIRLRHGLAAAPDDDGRFIYLFDQHRISPRQLRVTPDEFAWAQLINGQRTMREIHADAVLQSGGFLLPFEKIESLARQLDEALFLDNERFQNYLEGSEREPSCVGCYPAEPDEIREQFRELFIAPGGPGLPGEPGCRIESDGRIRAALVPHIDYGRGGVTYGWGFKEIFERTDASLFVIIGTSHYSRERFTLTRKNFKSPLGTVMTDQSYIDRLESYYGEGLFEDPVAHLPEHSIELEVVLFQYLYEGRRPFRIVPLLVGSFADCVAGQQDPGKSDDIQRMVDAL
ncbi:MAG: AmmeMemoRadiSam system protein B, partial [Planctomycetes bacterium]|nr:AmmeMemoRadiSam system protein B [Planctomycetota bacterium]